MSTWSLEQKQYLINNYRSMSARKIAEDMGKSYKSVKEMASSLKLKKRLRVTENEELKLEVEGREKTEEFRKIINRMKNLDKLSLILAKSDDQRQDKKIKGKIIQRTDDFIVVKTRNYCEAIRYVDVFTDKATFKN